MSRQYSISAQIEKDHSRRNELISSSGISPDYYPVDKQTYICLYTEDEFKKLIKDTIIFSVGGNTYRIGNFIPDLETRFLGRTIYGRVTTTLPLIPKTNKVVLKQLKELVTK